MRELCASATERVVLHGDLHHDNILRATRGWRSTRTASSATPGYETGPLLYDPDPGRRP